MPDPATSNAPMIPAADRYRLIRAQIEHEDNLISQRLSWFVASQSFLFTAYAIVTSNLQSNKLAWVREQQHLLIVLIPTVAVLSCLLIYVTILAGVAAIANLRRCHDSDPDLAAKCLPPVQGFRLTQLLGQAAPLLLPPIFLIVWLILLCRGFG